MARRRGQTWIGSGYELHISSATPSMLDSRQSADKTDWIWFDWDGSREEFASGCDKLLALRTACPTKTPDATFKDQKRARTDARHAALEVAALETQRRREDQFMADLLRDGMRGMTDR